MITLVANHIGVDTYLWLREAVGFKKLTRTQAVKALKNSLYVVAAYADDRIICYIQDLMIHPDYQKAGVGSKIIENLIAFVESIREDDTEMMLDLMCAKGREAFYEAHGFISRPNESLGPGMIRYLKERRA